MSWFTRPIATETTPRLTPLDKLAEVERLYRESEKEYDAASRNLLNYQAQRKPDVTLLIENAMYIHTNTLRDEDPTLRRLAADKQSALETRNRLLGERARLMRELRLIS